MSKAQLKKRQKEFERAKLKKYSELSFDLAKSFLISGFATLAFSGETKFSQKIISFLIALIATSVALNAGIKYLKEYHAKLN